MIRMSTYLELFIVRTILQVDRLTALTKTTTSHQTS